MGFALQISTCNHCNPYDKRHKWSLLWSHGSHVVWATPSDCNWPSHWRCLEHCPWRFGAQCCRLGGSKQSHPAPASGKARAQRTTAMAAMYHLPIFPVRLPKANKFRPCGLPIKMFTLTYFAIPYEHSTHVHLIFDCVSLAANSRAAFRLSIEKPITDSPKAIVRRQFCNVKYKSKQTKRLRIEQPLIIICLFEEIWVIERNCFNVLPNIDKSYERNAQFFGNKNVDIRSDSSCLHAHVQQCLPLNQNIVMCGKKK